MRKNPALIVVRSTRNKPGTGAGREGTSSVLQEHLKNCHTNVHESGVQGDRCHHEQQDILPPTPASNCLSGVTPGPQGKVPRHFCIESRSPQNHASPATAWRSSGPPRSGSCELLQMQPEVTLPMSALPAPPSSAGCGVSLGVTPSVPRETPICQDCWGRSWRASEDACPTLWPPLPLTPPGNLISLPASPASRASGPCPLSCPSRCVCTWISFIFMRWATRHTPPVCVAGHHRRPRDVPDWGCQSFSVAHRTALLNSPSVYEQI